MGATLENSIFLIIVLIMSVVIHEVSHGYAALMQGDPTAKYQGRLTLNPLKHLDPLGSVILPGILLLMQAPFVFGWAKPVPYNPYNLRNQRWGELLVALAGPASNVAIALIFGLFLRFGGAELLPAAGVQITAFIVLINLVLAVFNMIPVPPLDGSKVLFAFLPQRYAQYRMQLEQFGFIGILLILFLFLGILGQVVFFLFNLITGGVGL